MAKGFRSLCWVFVCFCFVVPGLAGEPADEPLHLVDLDERLVDPFEQGETDVDVFVFVRTDCPISNRYAPEFRRIHEEFSARGVQFWLVYPDPKEPIEAIRGHLEAYDYPCPALRDPRHTLVRRSGVRITPEVAVFGPGGEMVYRGRIDNRYVDFGKTRPAATVHDLELALDAVLDGRPVDNPRTRAVGCFIPDLR